MTIRVLVADDHTMVRHGVRTLLQMHEDIRVVAEASDGHEAVAAALEHKPDVAVLDINMPQMNGIEATEAIVGKLPSTRALILSMHGSPEYVYRAIKAGAFGYVLKDSPASVIVAAVRSLHAARRFLDERIKEQVWSGYLGDGHPAGPLDSLSPRERTILQRLAEGRSNAEIAEALGLSVKTVETYRSRLMHKLGLRDLHALIMFALRHGLTTL